MSISVCLATRGDPRELAPFLQSFAGLRLPADVELIVVMNTAAPADIRPLHGGGAALRVLHEPVPGKSRCLNRALAAAQGDLLVFTDDDVTFDPAWLEHLDRASRRYPAFPIFGGAVRVRGEVPAWVRDSVNLQGILLSEHWHGDSEHPYLPGLFPFGPNMAVRRAAVEGAGARWNEALGPGTRQPVGDEPDFLAQISRPVATDRMYVPAALVWHEVEPSYFRLGPAMRRTFLNGWAAGRLGARYGSAPEARSVATRTLERLRRLGSARELVCNVTRAAGFFAGRSLDR